MSNFKKRTKRASEELAQMEATNSTTYPINEPVTFEYAEKLKEWGYDESCTTFYTTHDKLLVRNSTNFCDNTNRHWLSAPTNLEAYLWLMTVCYWDFTEARAQYAEKEKRITLLKKALTRMVAEFDTTTPVIPNPNTGCQICKQPA
jgi:hypothetical protein